MRCGHAHKVHPIFIYGMNIHSAAYHKVSLQCIDFEL